MTPYWMARRQKMEKDKDVKERLAAYLKELHLPAFRTRYEELVRLGRRVLFRKCGLLVQELLAAKRDLKLPALLKRLAGYEALIVDDLGYVQQSREEMEVLFTLLAERYERGSVLLTSNLPFSGWEAIFKDPMTTAAAIDRLVHHSVIIELNLPSYRAEQAKKAKQRRQADADESADGPGTGKP